MFYQLLPYIALVIITLLGFNYLFNSKTFVLKEAFNKNAKFLVTNSQYLLLFIFATAIIGCGGSLMVVRLLMCIVITFLGLFVVRGKIPITGAVVFYTLYLLWLVIEIFLSPVKTYGLRVFMKYLYPFLIMLFACKVSQSGYMKQYYLKILNVVLYVGLMGVLWQLLVSRIPFFNQLLGTIMFWGPAIIDFYPVPLTIALILYSYTKRSKYLIYAVLFILPSVFGAIRTGILAMSITIVVFAVVRYKVKSLPYVFAGIALLVGTILFVPAIRDKMFVKQMSSEEIVERRDELTKDDIDSSGRFAMWEWSMANFYEGKELTGSGLGQLQFAFYNWDHPFGRLRVVHNDYVQILCDTGLVGLGLYALTMLMLIIHSLITYFTFRNTIVKMAALVAGISMAGMVSTLYTDNVVNYSLMTLSFPFALYGVFLGLKAQMPEQDD